MHMGAPNERKFVKIKHTNGSLHTADGMRNMQLPRYWWIRYHTRTSPCVKLHDDVISSAVSDREVFVNK